jgi:hypothetical protein
LRNGAPGDMIESMIERTPPPFVGAAAWQEIAREF